MTNFVLASRNWRDFTQSRKSFLKSISVFCALCLASVMGIGVVIALGMQMQTAVLVCLGLFGLCGAVLWLALNLPVVTPLRIALIASFWFRLETELFPILKAGNEQPLGINLSLKLILTLMLTGIAYFSRPRIEIEKNVIPKGFIYSLIFLWGCALLSVAYGKELLAGLYSLFGLATVTLICFVAIRYFSKADALRQMILCVAVAMIFNGILGILQYAEIFGGWKLLGSTVDDALMTIPDSEISRASGLLEMSNSFGWYLATFLPILIAPILLARKSLKLWQTVLCLLAIVFGVIALILTFSRGSWAAFVLTIPLLMFCTLLRLSPQARWQMIQRSIGILLIAAALSFPFMNAVIVRLTQDDHGAAASRISLMEVATEMIWDNPWFGVGLSSYESAMRAYDLTEGYVSEDFPYPVHNMFLHIAAEAGIPALIFLLLMIFFAMQCGWQVWRDRESEPFLQAMSAGLMVGMLAFLLTGLKELTTIDAGHIRIIFLLSGLLIANRWANNKARKERSLVEVQEKDGQ